jgi:hypothetical protein
MRRVRFRKTSSRDDVVKSDCRRARGKPVKSSVFRVRNASAITLAPQPTDVS